MAIWERFKKKKKEEIEEREKPKIEKEKIETLPEKDYNPPTVSSRQKAGPYKKREIPLSAWQILKSPHITEKATDLAAKNQYTFKVYSGANKTEIKKAIEDLFGVDVLGVKIVKVPPKKRRLGRISGWRKGYKKAIVKIKEGQKIEVLPR